MRNAEGLHALGDGRAALVLDRFTRALPGVWIDLATNREVTIVDVSATAASTADWLERCDVLVEQWHTHVVPLVDYGIADQRTRVEVYPRLETAPCPRTFRQWGRDAIAAWFAQLGRASGRVDSERVAIVAGRPRVLPQWNTGLSSGAAQPGIEDAGAPRVRCRPIPGHARAMGIRLAHPDALAGVLAVLDGASSVPAFLRVQAQRGAGLTTFLSVVAREARRRGLVPVCAAALERPHVLDAVRERTVVLLIDEGERVEASHLRALTVLLRARVRVACVLGTFAGPNAERAAITLAGVRPDVLRARIGLFPPPCEASVANLVRSCDGLPGLVVDGWLSGGPARVIVRTRVRAGDRGTGPPDAWSVPTIVQTSRVAEGQRVEPSADRAADRHSGSSRAVLDAAWRGWRAAEPTAARRAFERVLDAGGLAPGDASEAMWGVGLCELDRANLLESERWLRAASAAFGDDGPAAAGIASGARLALARCLCWQGRLADVQGLLGACAGEATGGWAECRLRARVESQAGRVDRALAWLRRGLAAGGLASDGRAALHVEYARVHRQTGDLSSARAHLREALAVSRQLRDRRAWLRLRVAHLEVLTCLGTRPAEPAARRAAGRLLTRAVPPLVRLRSQRALELLGWGRTHDVSAFVERWGESALWPPPPEESAMVSDLQAVLEICRDTDEPLPALERVCHCVRDRLRASSVAIHAAAAGRGRLALAGSARLPTTPLAQRLVDSGQPARATPTDAGIEAGVPIMYAGRTIGAVVCRWTGDRAVDAIGVEVLLSTAATALAPHLEGVLERERRRPDAGEETFGLLGDSAALRGLRERVRRVALAPFHVLIEGESGSGKEVVARALHAAGPRRHRRFCALNCAALSDELVEAELFGHSRGAFTGAVGERAGLFEEADGGTLFLDEVGELSPRAQAKLLRVIQDGEVRRVGENLARRVDPRLIAATNRDLRGEAASGRFRTDLLYRLDVVRLVVPPLRERPEDVVQLARTFWADAVARVGSRATLHPGTLAALARYPWPGNVRELQNVIMALAVNAPPRGTVTAGRLPGAIAARAEGEAALTLDAARRSFEERFVRAALARAGNRPGRAARDLGLTRQGLRKVLVRLHIGATLSAGARSDGHPADACAPRAGPAGRAG